jgi:hypothetical protein
MWKFLHYIQVGDHILALEWITHVTSDLRSKAIVVHFVGGDSMELTGNQADEFLRVWLAYVRS